MSYISETQNMAFMLAMTRQIELGLLRQICYQP